MRRAHAGGEELFVDCADETRPMVIDRLAGEIRGVEIFVAMTGASSFSYAQAT
jgi:transposase